jgi:hypothetical protein
LGGSFELACGHGLNYFVALEFDRALVADDHTIPTCRYFVYVLSVVRFEDEVDKVGGSARNNRSFNAKHFTRDNFCGHASLRISEHGNRIRKVLLVLRLAKLIFGVKIDPKLESERGLVKTGRHLCVHDAFASCHPLDISRTDPAAVTFEVLMQNFVLQHVSDSFEAAMRVIREAGWQLNIKQVKH